MQHVFMLQRIPIRENGLVGTLFRQETADSAIIVLGGSSGGLNEERAERLASHGFNTLALAYFGAESLPPTLNQIPLEYFERAIGHLKSEQGIERIGIWGGSRGGELSLILGTLFPETIGAIAAHVPSSVIYGAFDDEGRPAWTYRGRPVAPNAPFVPKTDLNLGKNKETAIAATPWFLGGMEDEKSFAESAIPVEKIRCPLLLISAQDDQMWPSALFAQQIVDRLAAHKSSIPTIHLSYPGVGHAPGKGTVGLHPILKRWFAYGGSPEDNALAAQDWHEQTVLFFKQNLSGSSSCLDGKR